MLDHEGLQGLREFHNEMRLLCSIRHPNVVRLLGYAAEGQTQCLVYELMSRGNLEDVLAGKQVGREGSCPSRLPWQGPNVAVQGCHQQCVQLVGAHLAPCTAPCAGS